MTKDFNAYKRYVKFKNYERKIKSPFMIYASFERMESKIQQNVIQANTKNILLAFIAIN